MRLLSYNIQYGFGADGIYDLTRSAKVMQPADIIALQEVERHWSRTVQDDQPALLQSMLPEHFAIYGPAFDMDASRRDGDQVINRRRQFGTMILSRWPIVWSRMHLLPMRRMVTPLNTQSGALEAMIDTPLGPLRIWSVHLAHVGVEERLLQFDCLLALRATSDASGPPWSGTDDEPDRNWTEGEGEPPNPTREIWLGDFNCEPGSLEHQRITGQTPYHPSAVYADRLVDAVSRMNVRLYTHEKMIAGATRRRQLDHCFLTADLLPNLRKIWTDPEQDASDHLPLWVEIA
jgi:endonuclease/exonuclease/phosphatase family metal-dependent hydrolase